MTKIELVAKKRYGFKKAVAEQLINDLAEAHKHYWRWCERQGIREGFCEKGYAKENYAGTIEQLHDQERQEYELKEFAEIRKAIKARRLVVRHTGGLHWNVGYIKHNEVAGISLIKMKVLCGYPLNYGKGTYCMSVYGTSRPLEIILGYGYHLGLDFKDIPQNQQVL